VALVTFPFMLLGLGSGGFFTTYLSQRFVDQGILFRLITLLIVDQRLQFVLQGSALLAFCGLVFWLHLRHHLRSTVGILALSAAWIVISPHLFPWYVAGQLPFLALYLRLPTAQIEITSLLQNGLRTSYTSLLPLALWLFVLEMPFTYVIFAPRYNANLFLVFFAIPLLLAGMAGGIHLWMSRRTGRGPTYSPAVATTQVVGSLSAISLKEE
jgi:hypothetical protein